MAYQDNDSISQCASEASGYYGVPLIAIRAVMRTENGKPGLAVQNRDGSYDLGVMQINDSQPWYSHLIKLGYSKRELVNDGCKNIWAGVYILSSEIYQARDFWRGIGNYHNRREPYHSRYIRTVKKHWNNILKKG